MFQCQFELNNQPMSTFRLSGQVYSAFSGLGIHANQRSLACMKQIGPIPPGRYFILDRQSGGRLV
ncbi:tlde1 domain-containing protein [Herbaspirillum sp. GCM10030257]|uniref:tlde1 domain-containing protein n=1 Tax=Herbaspirillum sp. GCM10030257 TaxID=3273393 RepID=UPI003609DDE4